MNFQKIKKPYCFFTQVSQTWSSLLEHVNSSQTFDRKSKLLNYKYGIISQSVKIYLVKYFIGGCSSSESQTAWRRFCCQNVTISNFAKDAFSTLIRDSRHVTYVRHLLLSLTDAVSSQDLLVRSKAQDSDETYYLWAMRFFMEFNRKVGFNVALVR